MILIQCYYLVSFWIICKRLLANSFPSRGRRVSIRRVLIYICSHCVGKFILGLDYPCQFLIFILMDRAFSFFTQLICTCLTRQNCLKVFVIVSFFPLLGFPQIWTSLLSLLGEGDCLSCLWGLWATPLMSRKVQLLCIRSYKKNGRGLTLMVPAAYCDGVAVQQIDWRIGIAGRVIRPSLTQRKSLTS